MWTKRLLSSSRKNNRNAVTRRNNLTLSDFITRISAANAPERCLALFGAPVDHSLSPIIHGAALAHVGLDWSYGAVHVSPDELPDAVTVLRSPRAAGANVTIPHKTVVLPLLDEVSERARAIGAVNTVFKDGTGQLIGENTDAEGFARPVLDHGGLGEDDSVLVWGAGGAARAVVYACIHFLGAAQVFVSGRTPERATALSDALGPAVRSVSADEASELIPDCAMLVNATPLGMDPHPEGTPLPDTSRLGTDTIVYDLVYMPMRTRLIRDAEAAGVRTLGGLDMLLAQAAPGFERWTGHPFPFDVVRSALDAHLQGRP